MVMEGEQNGVPPRNGVYCNVDWLRRPTSKAELDEFGDVADEVSVKVFDAPEVKLPKASVNYSLEWTKTEEMHPFWFIKRGKHHEDIPNMELIYGHVNHIMASGFENFAMGRAKVMPITETAVIQYPCLVNTVAIEPGQEVILKWEQQAQRGPDKVARERNAFVKLQASGNKARKLIREASTAA